MRKFFSILAVFLFAIALFSCSSSREFILRIQEHRRLNQPLAPPVDYKKVVDVGDVGYKAELVPYNGFLFIGNLNGNVYRIDPNKINKKLIVQLNQPIEASVAVSKDYLYVGSVRGLLYKVSLKTDKVLLKRQFPFPIVGSIYIKNGKVYFTTENDKVYCLNSNNFNTIWKYNHGVYNILDIRGFSGLFFGKDGILVGFDDGTVDKISYRGDQEWEAQAGQGSMFIDSDTTPLENGDIVYITSVHGYTEAVNSKDGELIWKRDISSYSNMQLNIYGLFLADENGNVYCLDNSNGETIWKTRLTIKGNIYSIKLVGNVVYAITSKGKLVALDALRGRVMDIKDLDDDFSSHMTLCCNKIFVVSRSGSIYSIFSK